MSTRPPSHPGLACQPQTCRPSCPTLEDSRNLIWGFWFDFCDKLHRLFQLARVAPTRGRDGPGGGHLREAYVQGISTGSVDDLVKALGMSGVPKSQVSRLCGEFDERVEAFLSRQIEADWPDLHGSALGTSRPVRPDAS